MKIDGSAVRTGMVIEYDGKLWQVVKHEIRTPGNLRSFNQVELKDIISGTKTNTRLSSSETVERASLDTRNCTFLYDDGDNLNFMDAASYEQFTIPRELLGDRIAFLQDNMTISVEFHETRALNVRLPEKVILTIAETEPVVKGQTAASSYKPAIMENGIRVMVPPFISTGERIVVDTNECTYFERAK